MRSLCSGDNSLGSGTSPGESKNYILSVVSAYLTLTALRSRCLGEYPLAVFHRDFHPMTLSCL